MDVLSAGNVDIFSQTTNQSVELESLANEAIKGGIDQYVDSTDVLDHTGRYRRFWSMYQ